MNLYILSDRVALVQNKTGGSPFNVVGFLSRLMESGGDPTPSYRSLLPSYVMNAIRGAWPGSSRQFLNWPTKGIWFLKADGSVGPVSLLAANCNLGVSSTTNSRPFFSAGIPNLEFGGYSTNNTPVNYWGTGPGSNQPDELLIRYSNLPVNVSIRNGYGQFLLTPPSAVIDQRSEVTNRYSASSFATTFYPYCMQHSFASTIAPYQAEGIWFTMQAANPPGIGDPTMAGTTLYPNFPPGMIQSVMYSTMALRMCFQLLIPDSVLQQGTSAKTDSYIMIPLLSSAEQYTTWAMPLGPYNSAPVVSDPSAASTTEFLIVPLSNFSSGTASRTTNLFGSTTALNTQLTPAIGTFRGQTNERVIVSNAPLEFNGLLPYAGIIPSPTPEAT